jgi:hypothetical protein
MITTRSLDFRTSCRLSYSTYCVCLFFLWGAKWAETEEIIDGAVTWHRWGTPRRSPWASYTRWSGAVAQEARWTSPGCFYFGFLDVIKKICIYTQVLYQSIYYFNDVLALHIFVILVSISIIMRRHSQHDHRKNDHIIVVFILLLLWRTLVSSLIFLTSSTALDHRSTWCSSHPSHRNRFCTSRLSYDARSVRTNHQYAYNNVLRLGGYCWLGGYWSNGVDLETPLRWVPI